MAGCLVALKARAGDAVPLPGQSHPGAKSVRLEPVLDSLETDMLGLLAMAEQGRVSTIRGEHYVPGSLGPEAKEIGEEGKKKLQARLTGTSFKLKIEEARTWEKISRNIDREIANHLVAKKKYRILSDPDTTFNDKSLVISACLRLIDTVYVWTPGCNCPKPKSSALATCAVILDARALNAEKRPVWEKREVLFYAGLEESLEGALSEKSIKKYVRDSFKSLK